MNESFTVILHNIASIIEMAGAAIISIGGLITLGVYLNQTRKNGNWIGNIELFRRGFGKAILLGLEFLVGADIIETVTVEPNVENLYTLGLVVIIRTFLSFSLEIEIEGQLPWRRKS